MAGTGERESEMTLPPLSGFLLRLSIPREFQSEILGDLAEDFRRRSALSARDARRWIRRDAIAAAFSFPGEGMNIAAAAGAAAGAYAFAVIWEIFVASPVARLGAPSGTAASPTLFWPLFLSAQMAGFAIAGAFAGALIRRPRQGPLMGFLLGALPLIAAVAAPVILMAALSQDFGLLGRRLDWFAAACLAVAAGSILAGAPPPNRPAL